MRKLRRLFAIFFATIVLVFCACSDEVPLNEVAGTYFREPPKLGLLTILHQNEYQFEYVDGKNGRTVVNGSWVAAVSDRRGVRTVVFGGPLARIEGLGSETAVALEITAKPGSVRLCYGPSNELGHFCYVRSRS